MKRNFAIALLFVLLAVGQSFALIGLRVGANANLVQPSATLALDQAEGKDPEFNPTGFGITGFAMANILFINVTADVGYINFGEQNFDYDVPLLDDKISASAKVTAVPIMIGLRKEFGLPVGPKFHIGAQVGVHNFTYTYEFEAADFANLEEEKTESKFSVAPVVGLRMGALDASLLYMIIEDFNYVGLRVGYTFGFGI
jgi:hypothetical protein